MCHGEFPHRTRSPAVICIFSQTRIQEWAEFENPGKTSKCIDKTYPHVKMDLYDDL